MLLSLGTYILVWAMFQASSLGTLDWHPLDNISKLFLIWFIASQALFAIITGTVVVHSSCTQMSGKEITNTGSLIEMQDSPSCVWNQDKIKAKFICSLDLDRSCHLVVLERPLSWNATAVGKSHQFTFPFVIFYKLLIWGKKFSPQMLLIEQIKFRSVLFAGKIWMETFPSWLQMHEEFF